METQIPAQKSSAEPVGGNASKLKLVSVVAVALLLLAALVLKGWICRIPSLAFWDLGPSYRALDLRNLRSGKPLYSDFRVPPYRDANAYNPLCYYLAALLVPLFDPSPTSSLEAGRLLVVLSTIWVCVLIFLNARRSGARADAAIIACLAFALSPVLQPWGFEFRTDVPALACELTGLYAFQIGFPYGAVAFFELAFLAKQGCAAGLISMIAYLWLTGSPRSLPVKLGLTWLAMTAASAVALQIKYPHYFLNTYYTLSPIYDVTAAPYFLSRIVFHHLPLFLLAIVNILRTGPRRSVFVSYLVLAICHDALAATRWGSNFYYFLPTLAAAAILAAPEISVLLERCRRIAAPLQVAIGTLIAVVILFES
jgi:hypothetical protein